MPTYKNGSIPRGALISFGSGHDKDGRFYEWLLPPRTYRKHRALVKLGVEHSGRTLRPSVGYSCYRPLDEQHYARRVHGNYAAAPGTSSHGGDWAGPPTGWAKVDAAAIDYSNYIEVFGSEEAFFDACRQVGLVPQGIWPPAFPREAWHVIDLDNPYGPLPAGQSVTDFEEDEMSAEDIRVINEKLDDIRDGLGVGNFRAIPAADKNNLGVLAHSRMAVNLGYQILGAVGSVEDIDEVAIATALAPLLAKNPGVVRTLTDEDVSALAGAVADEQARRLAG